MLGIFSRILIFISLLLLLHGVDRGNFKTCEKSSFCHRNRKVYDKFNYVVDSDSIESIENVVHFSLISIEPKKKASVKISLLTNHVFRIEIFDHKERFRIPNEDIFVSTTFSLLPTKMIKTAENLIIEGQQTKAIVMLKDFKIEIFNGNEIIATINDMNKFNLEDESYFVKSNETEPVDYSESFNNHKDSRTRGPESVSLDVKFHNKEFAYGIPEHADSFALKNTQDTDPYRLYNLDVFEYELDNPMALYGSVPMVFISNGNNSTGMYWNNPTETWVDVRSTRKAGGILSGIFGESESAEKSVNIHWMSESGLVDLFILPGPNSPSVSRQYADLTGVTKLPPLWAIGYHQCRWNYNSQDDIMEVDANFDKYNIPVDVLWLDIEHTDGKRYFTWDLNKFPNPAKMVDDLLMKKRRLVTVVDPHIKSDQNYFMYKEGKENGYFVQDAAGNEFSGWCWPGSSAYPDFTDARVRKWWSETFLRYEPVREKSMFSWNDMGEPSVFNGPEISMLKDVKHLNGFEHRDVHNIYGMYIHSATWEGQLLRSNNKIRPFVLTRAFFAGSQRTAAVWTGDNKADWSHLHISLPMLLSLSITGITFCGADVGGFFNNPPSDLLVRWYQAGAYQPFFRAHAHIDTSRREPWLFDEESMKLIKDAIQARYAILPYWYTQFYLSEKSGQPVMTPLWYHYPEKDLLHIETSYTIGRDILVSPVTVQSETSHTVHLPKKEKWFDMKTNKMIHNEATMNVPVDMSTIPVYYRSGSIIPTKQRFRRSSQIALNDPYTLWIFIDEAKGSASGKVFIDDGETIEDPNAVLVDINFVLANGKGTLTFKVVEGQSEREKNLVEKISIFGISQKPKEVVKVAVSGGEKKDLRFTTSSNQVHVENPLVHLSGEWMIEFLSFNEEL